MKVWGLIDTRIGSSKQAIVLSRSLDENATIKNIRYNIFINLPNIVKPKKVGINFKQSDNLLDVNEDEVPDIIVFAGRRLAGIAIYLKKYFLKKYNKKIFTISVLKPDFSYDNFDLIILPKHDDVKKNRYKNIIRIDGAICSVDKNKIVEEGRKWKNRIGKLPTPFYSMMIGGDTKNKKLDAEKIGIFVKNLSNKVKSLGGTLLISTSRRTSQECMKEIEGNIDCNNFFYKWNRNSSENPYFAFVDFGDVLIITGDSISMIAEVLSIQKPVIIYREEKSLEDKHKRFIQNLLEQNLVNVVNENEKDFKIYETEGLNELDRVKQLVFERINR